MPASWAAWLVVVASGWALRSRAYAIYRAVTLGLQVLIASALVRYFAIDSTFLTLKTAGFARSK